LAYHGLIPEAVYQVGSVTAARSRSFATPVGVFTFQTVPTAAPRAGVEAVEVARDAWAFAATPLRAIADLVCLDRTVRWDSRGADYLTDSLRIEVEELAAQSYERWSEIHDAFRDARTRTYLEGMREAAGRAAFLKTDSIGKIMDLELPYERHRARKIRIKLEINTNPPAGSRFEALYLAFPRTAALTTQTLESAFGTKAHALLCRSHLKGRDWYDFLWYVSRGVAPNLELLANALRQFGPGAGRQVEVNPSWFLDAMADAIREVDWGKARDDVRRFLPLRDQESLAHWGAPLFLQQLEKLQGYLGG
jgi:hypothetical protein